MKKHSRTAVLAAVKQLKRKGKTSSQIASIVNETYVNAKGAPYTERSISSIWFREKRRRRKKRAGLIQMPTKTMVVKPSKPKTSDDLLLAIAESNLTHDRKIQAIKSIAGIQ